MSKVFNVLGTISRNALSGGCVFLKVCGQLMTLSCLLGTPQPSSQFKLPKRCLFLQVKNIFFTAVWELN